MTITYNIKLFCLGADSSNSILMTFLLLVAEAIIILIIQARSPRIEAFASCVVNDNDEHMKSTIMFIIICDFFIAWQIFFLPQVKRSVIISQNLIELLPSDKSSSPNESFVSTSMELTLWY